MIPTYPNERIQAVKEQLERYQDMIELSQRSKAGLNQHDPYYLARLAMLDNRIKLYQDKIKELSQNMNLKLWQ